MIQITFHFFCLASGELKGSNLLFFILKTHLFLPYCPIPAILKVGGLGKNFFSLSCLFLVHLPKAGGQTEQKARMFHLLRPPPPLTKTTSPPSRITFTSYYQDKHLYKDSLSSLEGHHQHQDGGAQQT